MCKSKSRFSGLMGYMFLGAAVLAFAAMTLFVVCGENGNGNGNGGKEICVLPSGSCITISGEGEPSCEDRGGTVVTKCPDKDPNDGKLCSRPEGVGGSCFWITAVKRCDGKDDEVLPDTTCPWGTTPPPPDPDIGRQCVYGIDNCQLITDDAPCPTGDIRDTCPRPDPNIGKRCVRPDTSCYQIAASRPCSTSIGYYVADQCPPRGDPNGGGEDPPCVAGFNCPEDSTYNVGKWCRLSATNCHQMTPSNWLCEGGTVHPNNPCDTDIEPDPNIGNWCVPAAGSDQCYVITASRSCPTGGTVYPYEEGCPVVGPDPDRKWCDYGGENCYQIQASQSCSPGKEISGPEQCEMNQPDPNEGKFCVTNLGSIEPAQYCRLISKTPGGTRVTTEQCNALSGATIRSDCPDVIDDRDFCDWGAQGGSGCYAINNSQERADCHTIIKKDQCGSVTYEYCYWGPRSGTTGGCVIITDPTERASCVKDGRGVYSEKISDDECGGSLIEQGGGGGDDPGGGTGQYCFYYPGACYESTGSDCADGTLVTNCSSVSFPGYCNYGACTGGSGYSCSEGGCYPMKPGQSSADCDGGSVVSSCPSGTKPPDAGW